MSYIESLYENLSNINIEELPTELKKRKMISETELCKNTIRVYYNNVEDID